MIDTQRLGALLRQWLREDALIDRLRTTPATATRAVAAIGPEQGRTPPEPAPRGGSEPTRVSLSAAAAAALLQAEGPETAAAPQPAAGRGQDAHAEALLRSNLSASGSVAPLTDEAAPAAGAPAQARSASLVLSATGLMLLDALRNEPGDDRVPGSARDADAAGASLPRSAMAAKPLVAVPPHSEYATDRLALQLKDAVEFSGVFYESHLAQWADDRRPRALLAREPQAAWPASAPGHEPARVAELPGVARPLVREQLAVLDSGRFVWQGELWPGQRAMLSIEQEDEGQARDSDGNDARPHAPAWRMRLTLQFADLGVVDAQLHMAGEAVDIALTCDDGTASARLREAAPALRSAIAARALELHSLVVTDESAD